MATVNFTGSWVSRGVHKTTWPSLTNVDSGAVQSASRLSDKSIQVDGTFDGGTVTIEGSNSGPSGPFFTLTDPQGNSIALTSAGGESITENVQFIRPTGSGGLGGMSVNVNLIER